MTTRHPSWEEILAFVDDSSEAFSEHIEGCHACADRAADATRLVGLLRESELPDVPEPLADRAFAKVLDALGTDSVVASRSAGAILRRFVSEVGDGLTALWATLVADSQEANLAFRGSTYTSPRMLLYECPEFTISVSLSAGSEPRTVDVMGQVSPRSATELESGMAGLRVGESTQETALSEFGEFAFYAVPHGTVEIEVGLGQRLIRLAPISDLPES